MFKSIQDVRDYHYTRPISNYMIYKPSRIIQTGHCKGPQRYHDIIYTDIGNQLIYIQINSTLQ